MQKWCIFLTNIHLNIYLYINVFLRCATVICTRTGSMPFTNKFKYFFFPFIWELLLIFFLESIAANICVIDLIEHIANCASKNYSRMQMNYNLYSVRVYASTLGISLIVGKTYFMECCIIPGYFFSLSFNTKYIIKIQMKYHVFAHSEPKGQTKNEWIDKKRTAAAVVE